METLDLDLVFAGLLVTPFVGPSIAHFRNLQGMSQQDLAEATGLDLSAIKRLEAGRKRGGWVSSIETVCHALKITPEQLFHQARRLAEVDAMKRFFSKFRLVAS